MRGAADAAARRAAAKRAMARGAAAFDVLEVVGLNWCACKSICQYDSIRVRGLKSICQYDSIRVRGLKFKCWIYQEIYHLDHGIS